MGSLDYPVTVDGIIKWFFKNYERIEESTPRNDGEWVFIWGEPDSTQSIIEGYWGVWPEAAKLAWETIEHDNDGNDEWVPVPKDERSEADATRR